jgi:hypothetical protein
VQEQALAFFAEGSFLSIRINQHLLPFESYHLPYRPSSNLLDTFGGCRHSSRMAKGSIISGAKEFVSEK